MLPVADVVFDAVLRMLAASEEFFLTIYEQFLRVFRNIPVSLTAIKPFCFTQLFVLVVEVGAADDEADDCRQEEKDDAEHPFRGDFPLVAFDDALHLILWWDIMAGLHIHLSGCREPAISIYNLKWTLSRPGYRGDSLISRAIQPTGQVFRFIIRQSTC